MTTDGDADKVEAFRQIIADGHTPGLDLVNVPPSLLGETTQAHTDPLGSKLATETEDRSGQ